MMQLYVLLKFWRECIIVVLAFLLLICLFIQNHQAAEIKDQKKLHTDYVAAQQLSIAKAKADATIQEKVWAEQTTKVEQNYNVKIKQIQSDAIAAQSSANSMSKQLADAKQRLSAATKETVIEYTNTSGDILESCISEYRKVAQKADEHAADAERLSNAWP
ncbi:hypothetical protein [Acinetobacter guerrae]|uniref:hypothetical protein n=1 Tax=Acinetobacter guerrae TaxID=1843371 RepID=UPI00128E6325|nr:hypothetical protein [Acinetobacter guerrae]MPW44726.1 hypothetical protein [Acinetobacter guerrae]